MSKNVSRAENQQETHYQMGILRDYTSDTIRFSPELATLLAFLFTDGGVSKHGVESWRIYFTNSSLSAIKLFVKCMTNIFGIASKRIQVKKRYGIHFIARVTSKEIGKYLVDTFGTFRTLRFEDGSYPSTRLPLDELIKSNLIPSFLRVVFSIDGGVKFYAGKESNGKYSLRKNVCLACYHPILREQYCFLIKKLGIDAANIHADNVIRIQGEKSVRAFAENIGFIKGVTVTNHSRFWVGKEKNEVLRCLLESYENPRHFLKLFTNSNDIVRTA